MKFILHQLLFICLSLNLSAQITQFSIGALGSAIQSANGEISFIQSVGDVSGVYLAGNTVNFTTGFPQCFACNDCVGTVQVTSIETDTNFEIIPNPSLGDLFIKGDTDQIHSYTIHDIIGKLILKDSFTNNPIDLNSIPKGIYLIRFYDRSGNYLAVGKVVKE